MLVAHGLWAGQPGRLAIWAETSAVRASSKPGRPSSRPRPHPFCVPAAELTTILGALAYKAEANARTLLLPSRSGVPLDSPDLVRTDSDESTARTSRPVLAPWIVETVEIDADATLFLLRALPGLRLDRDPVFGASLRHLLDVGTFAMDLAGRGRVLPSIVEDGDAAEAVWRPWLSGADAAWARDLAAALPPVARAEVARGKVAASRRSATTGASAGTGDAGQIVAAALDALTDAAVRASLPKPTQKERARRPVDKDAAGAWLRALSGLDRGFAGKPGAVATLAREIAGWQADALSGSVRACFRLVEPVPEDTLFATGIEVDDESDDDESDDDESDDDESDDDEFDDDDDADAAGVTGPRTGVVAAPVREAVDDTQWRIEFLLQAVDEPSLVVDATQVWQAGTETGALARYLRAPQETLLRELGRARRLWPALDRALDGARPSELTLDADGAHDFLRHGAPTLHAAGFGVLLPSWWSAPSRRLGARLRASSASAPGAVANQSAVGLDGIVDYRWELALGDEPLTEEELHALAELRAPLVRVRGQWVEVDAKRLAAGLRRMSEPGRMTLGDLLRTGVDGDGPGGLPVTAVTADGPLGDLLSGKTERQLEMVDPPDGFRGTLRPYQRRGLSWLRFLESLGLGGVLADDMGLGKTVQLLALIGGDPAGSAPTLLVCPMSLVGNWQREAATFVPGLRVHVHHGAERARGDELAAAINGAALVVTTYALAARDAEALAGLDWHRVVLDEAQAIKNAATRQSVAVRAIPARLRLAVTGTPVENRLSDLWSLMDFASPGLLGSAADFKRRYAEPVQRWGDEVAAARLRRMTGPFVLRRVKTDREIISDLPEKLEMDVLCNLTAEQASLYRAVVDEMLAKIENSDGIERRGLVLATMTRLKQVCNHPAQLLHDDSRIDGRSGKLARLDEILEEVLAAGEKALLFTQYASFGSLLRGHLGARFGREVLFLHGGVGKSDRDAMVARFQSQDTGTPPLFVLSLKAGGTGLTLTAANHVVHVDRWWNPAVEDQATDRAFRIGQRRAVQVRKFVCAGTVEERIADMIREKRGLAERIVGTGEGWLTEMSTAQLRDLLTLDPEAVVE